MVISIDEAKERLEIPLDDISKDARIQSLISEFEGFAREECNRTFKNAENQDEFPGTFKSLSVEYISKKLNTNIDAGVQSESLGDHSISFNTKTDFSDTFYRTLYKHRKVKS